MKRNYTYHTLFLLIFSVLLFTGYGSFGQDDGLQPRQTVVNGHDYIVYLPEGYQASNQKDEYALLVYLHGGNAVREIQSSEFVDFSGFNFGIPALIDDNKWEQNNFIVMVPHLPCTKTKEVGGNIICDENEHLWDSDSLHQSILDVNFEYNVDKIYLTGISLGAKGVWDYAIKHRDIPAAIIPISGNAYLDNSLCALANIPIWTFHGDADNQVPPDRKTDSQQRSGTYMLVDHINNFCNPTYEPRLTKMIGKAHVNSVWDYIYNLSSGFDIYNWLLKHENNSDANVSPFVDAGRDMKFIDSDLPIAIKAQTFDSDSDYEVNWSYDFTPDDEHSVEAKQDSLLIFDLPVGKHQLTVTAEDTEGGVTSDVVEIEILASTFTGLKIQNIELYNSENELITSKADGYRINTATDGTKFNLIAKAPQGQTIPSAVRWTFNEDEHFRTFLESGPSSETGFQTGEFYLFQKKTQYQDYWIPKDDGVYNLSITLYNSKNVSTAAAGATKSIRIGVNEDPPPIILPVEFLDVTAEIHNKQVKINWSTASEDGNDYFTIERSSTLADNFVSIGTREGAGYSNSLKKYSFTDFAPLAGDAYYRVKQTDFDGKSDYSKIVKVKGSAAFEASLFPNPTEKGFMFIRLSTADVYTSVSVNVMDAIGNLVHRDQIAPEKLMQVDGYKLVVGNKLNPGLYFVIIEQGDKKVQKKLIVH